MVFWGILCLLNMDSVDIRRIKHTTKNQSQMKITGEVVLRTNQKTIFFFALFQIPPTLGTNTTLFSCYSGSIMFSSWLQTLLGAEQVGYSGFLEVSHKKNSCFLGFKTKIMSWNMPKFQDKVVVSCSLVTIFCISMSTFQDFEKPKTLSCSGLRRPYIPLWASTWGQGKEELLLKSSKNIKTFLSWL